MKNPFYALTAAALALSLAGCAGGSETAADAAEATTVASQTPSATASVDPLDRLPEQPFGHDVNAIAADPDAAGILWQLTEDQAEVNVPEALQTVLQILWLGNERQVLTGGPDVEKVQGSMKDLEHFVAPHLLEAARAAALPGLEFAQKVEAEGPDVDLPGNQQLWYPLHLGIVAAPSDPADEEKRASQWPEVKEGDPVGWVSIDGEEEPVPFRTDQEIKMTPLVYHVYDATDSSTSDVHILVSLNYDYPLMDGRTAVVAYPAYYQMSYSDSSWKVAGLQYDVQKATVTIKK